MSRHGNTAMRYCRAFVTEVPDGRQSLRDRWLQQHPMTKLNTDAPSLRSCWS